MREPPERKWNRVQKKIQQAIITSCPNPNHERCPDRAGLLDLARRAAELGTLAGDERWEHVRHCSPCYKEYLELRHRLRQARDGDEGGETGEK